MKIRLSPRVSDIIILVYAAVTLFVRFKFESNHDLSPVNSIVIGLSFVVLLVALIKLKVLNPNWFGLFNSKHNKIKK